MKKSRSSGILWGLPKCGKTTFLTGLPGKKLFIMFDPDGEQSIQDSEDITIMRMYENEDDVILRYCRDKLPTQLRKESFDSVVFDSLSTLGNICLNEAIRTGVGTGKDFKPTLEAPGLAAYGARTSNIVNIVNQNLRATGAVGAHCWFTSHEDEPKTDTKGNLLYITMTLSGKAISGIGLNVSELWHLRARENTWTISIANNKARQPMGSRMFNVTGDVEFKVKFDPDLFENQPHSIGTWFRKWEEGGRKKLPIPKLNDVM